jgi:alkylation response protein AidB-like acyl-CoA dehydrogenase
MRFTAEQHSFAESVRAFCAKECGTPQQRAELTEGGTLADSPALLRRLAELGWLGISLPAEYGGQGGTFVDECLFLEETARGLAPITAYGTGLTAVQTYLHWGNDEQKRTVVESICAGNFEAIALSEPGAGSDLASARMAAVVDGDDFVLDGQKTWTTAAHLATHILVLVRTDSSSSKHEGLTLLMVPADAPGLEVHAIDTMYGRTVNDLYFTQVRVPTSAVVGSVGRAWQQLNRGLGVERLIIAASSLGAAQRSFDDVLAYVTSASSSAARSAASRRSGTGSLTSRPRSLSAARFSTTSPTASTPATRAISPGTARRPRSGAPKRPRTPPSRRCSSWVDTATPASTGWRLRFGRRSLRRSTAAPTRSSARSSAVASASEGLSSGVLPSLIPSVPAVRSGRRGRPRRLRHQEGTWSLYNLRYP